MTSWNDAQWFSTLAGVALKSSAVLCVAWLVTSLMKGRSAAARHLVWTAALAATLVLPLLTAVLPALQIPGTALLPESASALFSIVVTPGKLDVSPAAPASGFALPLPSVPATAIDWRNLLLMVWIAGAAIAFLRLFAAIAQVRKVRRAALPFADRALCMELSSTLGICGPVEVLESKPGSMPMTIGVLRLSVLMPSDSDAWSDDRRRAVLLHELAHVRRGDAATQLLARAAWALNWWNPLAWIAYRESLKERERAADDMVLNAGTLASDYAAHLLDIAKSIGKTSPSLAWAGIAMARPSQLEGRLLAILDSSVNRETPSRRWALAAAVAAAALAVPIAAIRAQEPAVAQTVPADVEATIRAAASQKNHEMLDSAAKAAERAGKLDIAQKLLVSSAEIRGEVSGRGSVEYGMGLVRIAELEEKRHDSKAAEEFYTKAVKVLGDRPESARPWLRLGVAALVRKDFATAFASFESARRADPEHGGPAMMWMAVVREREQNPEAAETLFKQALSIEDPNSPEALMTLRVYARFLSSLGRADGAKDLDDKVAAAQKSKPRTETSVGVYKIGPGITPPAVLQKVEPVYSEEARAALLAGTVVLAVEIGPDGIAHNAQVVRGLGMGLDEQSIEAISKWRFRPGMKDGQPVTVFANIEVNWRLL